MKKKGFTLIELLVVIMIMGLLLGIILPSLEKVKETVEETIQANSLENIKTIDITGDYALWGIGEKGKVEVPVFMAGGRIDKYTIKVRNLPRGAELCRDNDDMNKYFIVWTPQKQTVQEIIIITKTKHMDYTSNLRLEAY